MTGQYHMAAKGVRLFNYLAWAALPTRGTMFFKKHFLMGNSWTHHLKTSFWLQINTSKSILLDGCISQTSQVITDFIIDSSNELVIKVNKTIFLLI